MDGRSGSSDRKAPPNSHTRCARSESTSSRPLHHLQVEAKKAIDAAHESGEISALRRGMLGHQQRLAKARGEAKARRLAAKAAERGAKAAQGPVAAEDEVAADRSADKDSATTQDG